MFTLSIKNDNKQADSEISFRSRAEAQEEVNKYYLRRRINKAEWNRLTDILSEPGVENAE